MSVPKHLRNYIAKSGFASTCISSNVDIFALTSRMVDVLGIFTSVSTFAYPARCMDSDSSAIEIVLVLFASRSINTFLRALISSSVSCSAMTCMTNQPIKCRSKRFRKQKIRWLAGSTTKEYENKNEKKSKQVQHTQREYSRVSIHKANTPSRPLFLISWFS